jgi:hypothetical protein
MTVRLLKIICVCIAFSFPLICDGAAVAEVFSTWEGFETDKCASIWLIKRFVDKNAEIRFFPKGSKISKGILFDVPEARFRRYHNMSTYGAILKYYKLKDPKLIFIGKIIHDIEINVWEKKVLKETSSVQQAILTIIDQSGSPTEIIEKTCRYFDRFYDRGVP